jgi:hypothetical protein
MRNYALQGPVRWSVRVRNNAPFQDFRAQQNLLIQKYTERNVLMEHQLPAAAAASRGMM